MLRQLSSWQGISPGVPLLGGATLATFITRYFHHLKKAVNIKLTCSQYARIVSLSFRSV